MTLSEVCYPKQ